MDMKITLLGLEKWLNSDDSSLFENIQLPVSDLLEKDTLVNTILLECGEFPALYTDAEFAKFATENFFSKNYRTFEKWVKALELEYNPIENYDRMEEESYAAETDSTVYTAGKMLTSTVEGKKVTTSHTGKVETTSINYEGKVTQETTRPDTNVSTNSYAGFGTVSSGLEDGTRTTSKIGSGSNGTYTETAVTQMSDDDKDQGTVTVQHDIEDPDVVTSQGDAENPTVIEHGHAADQNDTTQVNRGPKKRNLRAHGNIGVTTSQKMLESELEIAMFNLYNEIARRYMVELTIPVYI